MFTDVWCGYRCSGAGRLSGCSVVGGGFTPFIAAASSPLQNWRGVTIYLLAGCGSPMTFDEDNLALS